VPPKPKTPPKDSSTNTGFERVEPLIHEIRGEKVILDSDLAEFTEFQPFG
jgi:hypothetical protein